jgi:hypothetical protein
MSGHIRRSGLGRRRILAAGVAGAVTAVAPRAIWAAVAAGATPAVAPAHQELLRIVCDLVIPATDTPGAVAAGVPAFVLVGLAHGLAGEHQMEPAGGLALLERLEADLNRRAGGRFTLLSRARQTAILTELDRAAYAQGNDAAEWRLMKSLIMTGYYTSEIGGSKELRYELVPGRWDPDLPLARDNQAWSSDWTAVQFG